MAVESCRHFRDFVIVVSGIRNLFQNLIFEVGVEIFRVFRPMKWFSFDGEEMNLDLKEMDEFQVNSL